MLGNGSLAASADAPFGQEAMLKLAAWSTNLPDTYRHIFRLRAQDLNPSFTTKYPQGIPMAADPPDDRGEGSILPGRDDTTYNVRRNLDRMMAELLLDVGAWATGLSDTFFHALPIPAASGPNLYDHDNYFAALQLAGPDPMMLARVTDPGQLPPLLRNQDPLIRDGQIPSDFKEALAQGRIYQTDFRRYAYVRAGTPYGGVPGPAGRFVTWPCAVFIASQDRRGMSALMPVAIALDPPPRMYNPEGGQLVTAFARNNDAAKSYWSWETAKRIFLTAAANYHELGTHLGRTHLVMERYALATYRQLPPWHPVGRLLRPHFKFMVATNYDAVQNLINRGGPIDVNFCTKVDDLLEIAKDAYATWDLRQHGGIENDLRLRGVDDPGRLPWFPYRDRGLPVYRAIRSFVEAYLGLWYVDGAAVFQDVGLPDWNAAIANEYGGGRAAAPLPNLVPPAASAADLLDQLVTACTNIIWTCGPQHSAVNYTQYPFFADAKTLPFGIHTSAPDMDKNPAGMFNTPRDRIRDQAAVITRLSAFRYDQLGHYKPDSGYLSEYGDLGDPNKPWAPVVKGFQSALGAIANQQEAPWGYDFLYPDKIINAISI
jgi:arachidonate 15-lipoxygenase